MIVRILEEDGAAIAPVGAHDPLALVPSAPCGRLAEAVLVQHAVMIPEPADLHPPAGMDLHMVGLEQPVVQLRLGDLQGEAALLHRRGEQGVGAVVLARAPGRRILAQDPILPDADHPGGDQVLHLGHRQHRVALRVGAAVGDIGSGEAQQVFQQQRVDSRETPLDGELVGRP
ncbi:hypothetical protein [Streptomyces sp. XH2]|uniref:hypothetical protein n=1 Tax=Streptomyces sp. XH2 TaxID=3412483 RepID=UPI003C7A948B